MYIVLKVILNIILRNKALSAAATALKLKRIMNLSYTLLPLTFLNPTARLASLCSLYQFTYPHITNPPALKNVYRFLGTSLTFLTFALLLPLDLYWYLHHSPSSNLLPTSSPSLFLRLSTLLSIASHILAFTRLIFIASTHDIPLTFDPASITPSTFSDRTEQRVRIRWRKPRKLRDAIAAFAVSAITGGVEDKEDLDKSSLVGGTLGASESKNRILSLQRSQVSSEGGDGGGRERWLTDARRRRGEQHDADLEEGDIGDPLGCAVRQTLGLGVSMAYEYRDPPEGTDSVPQLVHVLRARCVMSAVKRVRFLYDPDRARGEIEGGKNKEVLRDEVEREVEYIRETVGSISVFDLEPPDSQRGIDFRQVRGMEGPEGYREDKAKEIFGYQPEPKALDELVDEIRGEEYGVNSEGDEEGVEYRRNEDTEKLYQLLRRTSLVGGEGEEEENDGDGDGDDVETKFLEELVKERHGGDDQDDVLLA